MLVNTDHLFTVGTVEFTIFVSLVIFIVLLILFYVIFVVKKKGCCRTYHLLAWNPADDEIESLLEDSDNDVKLPTIAE